MNIAYISPVNIRSPFVALTEKQRIWTTYNSKTSATTTAILQFPISLQDSTVAHRYV